MSSPAPILRIEVEGVKHAILQHLAAGREQFEEIVADELERVDIEAMIRAELRIRLGYIVQDALSNACDEIGRELTRDARSELAPIIREAFTTAVRQAAANMKEEA